MLFNRLVLEGVFGVDLTNIGHGACREFLKGGTEDAEVHLKEGVSQPSDKQTEIQPEASTSAEWGRNAVCGF